MLSLSVARSASSASVDDLNVVGVSLFPDETDPILVIHPDTTGAIPLQFLQTIARCYLEIAQIGRCMES